MHSPSPGGEFDEFLFALIDGGRGDVPLTVLSALVRLNIDPWVEAGILAQMPRPFASQRLSFLIDALPDRSVRGDVGAISDRLIALLPSPPGSSNSIRPRLNGVGVLTTSQIVHNAIVMVFIFLMTEYIALHRQTPPQFDRPHASFFGAYFSR
jgi:hypothetical protein